MWAGSHLPLTCMRTGLGLGSRLRSFYIIRYNTHPTLIQYCYQQSTGRGRKSSSTSIILSMWCCECAHVKAPEMVCSFFTSLLRSDGHGERLACGSVVVAAPLVLAPELLADCVAGQAPVGPFNPSPLEQVNLKGLAKVTLSMNAWCPTSTASR